MVYSLLLQTPDFPIKETWSWETDEATSYNGSEERIPLLRYPRRMFGGAFSFDTEADVQRHLAMMTKRFRVEFGFPLFQYQVKLKAAVAIGAVAVTVNAKRGDFREGFPAVVIEGSTYEEVIIAAVSETELIFEDPLVNAYSRRAVVCPVAEVFTSTGAGVSRANPDHYATSTFTFSERVPQTPFIGPLNEAVISEFDGLPLIPYLAMGSTFEGKLATGLSAVDYTGLIDLVSPWTFSQWGYSPNFKADRMGTATDLEWWQVFAEEIQGSSNPFLFPTNRSDMEIITPAAGTLITVKGTEYSDHYWGHGSFSRIFIDTDAGRHYAKVTGVALVSGNDRLTYTPTLPVGAGWADNQSVGFLMKVRNENDKIEFSHYSLHSEVSLDLRTVV